MRRIGIIVVSLALCIILIGCEKNSPEKHTLAAKNGYPKEIIGTWEVSWESNGNKFHEVLIIKEDGYYINFEYKNDVLIEESYDIWYFRSSWNLVCVLDGNLGHCVVRTYKNGNLYMGSVGEKNCRQYRKKYN